ncbi:SRPBCC domain-containing protein [Streptomyces sp. NPDC046203]|uniref:SRPBCC domain-containing protein n=1 Tax=Streptomyces sp. NPDC046203 TaxID=3154602 RepID=UPI0034066853
MTEIPRGRSETHDIDRHLLRYVVDLPHPMGHVWHAVASPEGLARWLGATDSLEPRLGGRVTLRGPDGAEYVDGRVTAWDPEYVAEYTLDPPHPHPHPGRAARAGPTARTAAIAADTADPPHGRIRFHLEPGRTDAAGSAVLRFTAEVRGTSEDRIDRLADWHAHLERLAEALDDDPAGGRAAGGRAAGGRAAGGRAAGSGAGARVAGVREAGVREAGVREPGVRRRELREAYARDEALWPVWEP